jgi:cellulose biosynthesis protein BcsQ
MAKRRVIGVVSQKGGVGKSTLCQLIAREAASQG